MPTTGILQPEDGPAAEVLNASGRGRVVLVCEHASNLVPVALGGLGASSEVLQSHAAWDPGALPVAVHMAGILDAPLVAARFSRLVHDCNRPPGAPGAMPERTEVHDIPGNRGLNAAACAARVREVYEPFHDLLDSVIAGRKALGLSPVLVTVHSFTPVWLGAPRRVELGILHDADPRLADAMLQVAANHTALLTERNAPYGPGDGVMHTVQRHALPEGLLNVMIELRNDLIRSPEEQARHGAELAAMVEDALALLAVAPAAGGQR